MKHELSPSAILPPCPVTVVCTYDENEKPNGLAVSWTGVAVSEPPHVMIAIRPNRYSYKALLERKVFTLNIPSEDQVSLADYFGVSSGKRTNKFEDTNLTPVMGKFVHAPTIAEFPLSYECKIISEQSVGSHMIFIAEVLGIFADERILNEEKKIDVEKLKPISYDASSFHYFGQGKNLGPGFSIGKMYKK